jgi:hypothetical protein
MRSTSAHLPARSCQTFSLGFLVTMMLGGCNDTESSGPNGPNASDAPATNDSCKVTLTGEVELTTGCTAQVMRIAANVSKEPTLMIGATSGVALGFQILEVTPRTGAYQTGHTNPVFGSVADLVEPPNPQRRWTLRENYPSSDAISGSYTAEITGVSLLAETVDYANWSVDGLVNAVYEPDGSTGAAAEIIVHVEF